MTQPQSVCSLVNERPQQIIAFRDAQIETLFKKLGRGIICMITSHWHCLANTSGNL